jgi:hypothetical protein
MEVVAGWLLTSKYLNSSKLFSLKESRAELPALRKAETFCARQTSGPLVLIGAYPTPIRIFYLAASDAAAICDRLLFPIHIHLHQNRRQVRESEILDWPYPRKLAVRPEEYHKTNWP